MNRHCIPGLTMSGPDGEGVSGNNKTTCTQGLARTRIALCQRLVLTRKKLGRYDLAWKDLCSVRMLSVNSNELSKV